MKDIYKKIWALAKPYYMKGRPMDIDHIEWMIDDALLICQKENIDDALLLPLVILHDVGYGDVPQGNPFNVDLRKAHTKAGEKITKNILTDINYDSEKSDKISYYVSVHDNWALDDNEIYLKDIILGSFNDLDFMWMATPKGFPALKKILNKNDLEMIEYLKKDDKLINRPFSTSSSKNLFYKYLENRSNEFKNIKN